MKRKIMACILAAALGITGVSFPTAAKTVSVGKNVKKYNCKREKSSG